MKNIKLIFAPMAFILLACGALATTVPAPTNTPMSPPTETPVPAPATLEPSPTPNPILFQDSFEGSLGDGWQWVDENKNNWDLTNNPGWLEIMARAGSVGSGDMENLLLRQAPDGNFELETKLKFKPAGNFQIAGLLIYESAANYVLFGRAFCGAGSKCVGDGYYLDMTSGGSFASENFATAAPETDLVYLRLRREANAFTAYASEDGTDWKLIGAHISAMKPLLVGLAAGQAVNTAPQPAQFDYFVSTALP